MIHEDGIEVYLKPHGSENEDVKFAEFPLHNLEISEAVEGRRNRRCFVLAHEGNFDVVFRCLPQFEMFSASAVLVETHDGQNLEFTRDRDVVQRTRIFDQRIRSDFEHGNVPNRKRGQFRMMHASQGAIQKCMTPRCGM